MSRAFFAAFALCGFLGACLPEGTIAPAQNPSPPATPAAAFATSPAQNVQWLAQAVAAALNQSRFRTQVLEDLRDSPFPQHTIHLQSYFRGPRGAAISEAAARQSGVAPLDFLAQIEALPEMEIGVSSRVDQVTWRGSADIVVVATALANREWLRGDHLIGYDVTGNLVRVPLSKRSSNPVLSILPARRSFGADSERKRAAAPKRLRGTISTPDEVFTTQTACDPLTAVIECSDENGGATGGWQSGIDAGAECTLTTSFQVGSAADADYDGIKDLCESRVALGLQPKLVRHNDEVYFGREPYWTVKRINGVVTIMYLLAYYYDGPPYAHHGDSEFIILTVRPSDSGHWTVSEITTSAHWGVCCSGDFTETYGAGGFIFDGAAAYVYVSRSHHGNYRTLYACESRLGDDCSSVATSNVELVGVVENGNIGNSLYPFDLDPGLPNSLDTPADCTRSRGDPALHPGTDCFFSDTPPYDRFRGWSGNGEAARHYKQMLQAYSLF